MRIVRRSHAARRLPVQKITRRGVSSHGPESGCAARCGWSWNGPGGPFCAVRRNACWAAGGVPVSLTGDFRTRLLWRPMLHLQHVRIGAAQGVELPFPVDAQQVELQWRWRDLWRWRQGAALRLRLLAAARMDVRLTHLVNGRASWELGGASDTERAPIVEQLGLDQAHFKVDDAVSRRRGSRSSGARLPCGAPPGWTGICACARNRWRLRARYSG